MHVSVRVPWHDSRWAGKICANPRGNTSCLILPRIAETKDDDFEADHAKADWSPDGARLPACAAERGAFMAPVGYARRVRHPYSHDPRYLSISRKASFTTQPSRPRLFLSLG
jgi:hypothetical protein